MLRRTQSTEVAMRLTEVIASVRLGLGLALLVPNIW